MRDWKITDYFKTIALLAPTVLQRCPDDEPEDSLGDEPERGPRLEAEAAQLMERIRSILRQPGDAHDRLCALQALVFELDPT